MKGLDPAARTFVRPARRSLAVLVVAQVVQTATLVATAFAIAGGVQALVRDRPVGSWAAAVAIAMILRALTSGVADRAAARAAETVATDLRERVLRHLAYEPGAAGADTGRSALLATHGVDEVKPYLTRYLPAVLLTVLVPPVVLVALLGADPLTALIVVLTLPLVPVFGALVGLHTRDRAERRWRELGSLAGHFVDVVRGLPTLVAFRRAERQVEVIRSTTHRYRRATMETLRLAFASSAVLELVATLSVALVAVSVGLRLAAGDLDLRTGLFVLLLAPEAYLPFRRAGSEFHAAATGRQAFADAADLLAQTTREPLSDAVTPVGATAPIIRLDHVTVRRSGSAYDALRTGEVQLPSTGLVAVCGRSGSGKTTLLDVLRGQLTPTTGTVTVDGVDLRQIDADGWRRRVAWLPQQPVFVSGSIRDNLVLARPDADDAELWTALADVGLAEMVASLPGGLDAPVEEDARTFSAGERARLSMARILVARRSILLLDEPSAHLDRETEQLLGRLITRVAGERLVVVVTHSGEIARLSDLVVELTCRDVAVAAPKAVVPRSCTESSTDSSTPADVATAFPDAGEEQASGDRARAAGAVALGVLASLSGVALTATAGWLIVKASEHPPVLTLMVAIVGVRTFGLARPCLRYAERLISHDVALRRLATAREQLFAALVPLTPGRLGRRRGELLDQLVEDAEAEVDRRLRVWLPLTTIGGACVLVVGFLALAWPGLAGPSAALVLGAGAAGLLLWFRTSKCSAPVADARRVLADQTTRLIEVRAELRWWDATDRVLEEVTLSGRRLERLTRHERGRESLAGSAIITLVGCATAASLLLVADAVATTALEPAWAGLLVLVPLALGELVQGLPDVAVREVRTRQSLRRLHGTTSQSPLVTEPRNPQRLAVEGLGLTVDELEAGWGERDAVHLDAASWPAGQRVAVSGPSGSGKSTLAATLVRYLDPHHGEVSLGGVSLRSASLTDVRRRLLLVDDRPHLFATTLRNNLRIGRPGAADSTLVAVIHSLGLASWFDDLADGLDTMLGEGHRPVSGGELTRLALARALLADPDVLVLDEPTAHLDAPLAQDVIATILVNAGDRTVILFSHREPDLDACDEHWALSDEGCCEHDLGAAYSLVGAIQA